MVFISALNIIKSPTISTFKVSSTHIKEDLLIPKMNSFYLECAPFPSGRSPRWPSGRPWAVPRHPGLPAWRYRHPPAWPSTQGRVQRPLAWLKRRKFKFQRVQSTGNRWSQVITPRRGSNRFWDVFLWKGPIGRALWRFRKGFSFIVFLLTGRFENFPILSFNPPQPEPGVHLSSPGKSGS